PAPRPGSMGTIEGVVDFAKAKADEAEGKKDLAAAAPPPKKKKRRGFFSKIGNFFKKAVSAVGNVVKKVASAIKKIAPILMTVASIASMVIPGLQPLGVALMAIQGAQSGVQMVKGIAKGDWKAALQGAVGVASAFAGGVAAGGARMFGDGLRATAAAVGNVANTVGKGMAVMEAVKTGNPAALVGAAASFAGSALSKVQGGADALAKNLEKYGEKAVKFADAVANKRWGDALSTAAGTVAGAANGDKNQNLVKALGHIEKVSAGGQGVADAIKSKDGLAVASAAAGLLNATGSALNAGKKFDTVTRDIGTLADQATTVRTAARAKDGLSTAEAAASLLNSAGGMVGAGQKFQNVTRDVGSVASQAQGIRKAARSNDVGGAATKVAGLGVDLGKMLKADEKTQQGLEGVDREVNNAVKKANEAGDRVRNQIQAALNGTAAPKGSTPAPKG
ncbi:MAG: hypothetical protein VKP57_12590, partial [Candidatus Sericytochromatia bacterium]|nr:hypothetical protein [Candidatus Sericytochromatia bacterium]